MAVATYTKAGAKSTTATNLDKAVFGLTVDNHELLKQSYLSALANQRANYAKTQTRGRVSGGGRKPWVQKGTGRARFGSSRNPIWRGGGVAFGPTGSENYKLKLNSKARQIAVKQSLSLAAKADRIKVIEDIAVADGKTKSAAALLKKLDAKGKTVIVLDKITDSIKQASRNLPMVKIVNARRLDLLSIMDADAIIFTKPALAVIADRFGGKS